jgi:hypothetical protein
MTYEKLTDGFNDENYDGDDTMTEAEGGIALVFLSNVNDMNLTYTLL